MFTIDLPDGANLRTRPEDHATLADAAPGALLEVCRVRACAGPRRRLLEMGFVSGTRLRVVRLAPFGDPMQVEMRGSHLSLRRLEARDILVRPVD
ncbi:MAG: FeoA family protein [Planctomycetota bacterium]|jgi:ferrous iron transport protein A